MLKDQTKKIKVKRIFFFSKLLLLPQSHLASATTLLTQVGIFASPSLKLISPMITKLLLLLATATTLFNTSVDICYYSITTIDIVDITNNNVTSRVVIYEKT